MRNLKKILALVLALMMTLSLMVTANASDFKDDSSISEEYTEAVDVLEGMGIYQGDSDNQFLPNDTLKRKDAAVLVYRVISGDVDGESLSNYKGYAAEKFSDVSASAWYEPYVAYATNGGYIQGDGKGHFNPDADITGTEVLTILLRAVGYDRNGEFSKDWPLNVATLAKELGITKTVASVNLTKAVTREVVAELIFQTITKAYTVKYTLAFGYQPVYEPVTNSEGKTTYEYITLGQKTFDLVKGKRTEIDVWGRPGYSWTYNTGDEITTFAEPYLAQYVVATTECQVATDVGFKKTQEFDTYTNGKANLIEDVELNAADTVSTIGAQGRITEVYSDRIVYIDTYLAEVANVTNTRTDAAGHLTRNALLELHVYNQGKTISTANYQTVYVTAEKDYSYTVGQMVLVNAVSPSATSILTKTSSKAVLGYAAKKLIADKLDILQVADSFVGSQSYIYWNAQKHEIGGTTYDDAVRFYLDEASRDQVAKHTWYLDQFGNLIGATDIISTNYAVLADIQWVPVVGENGYAQATLVDFNGEKTTVKVKTIDGDDDTTFAAWENKDYTPIYNDKVGNVEFLSNGGKDWLRISDELSRNKALRGYALYRVDENLDGTVSLEGYGIIGYNGDVKVTTNASALLVKGSGTTYTQQLIGLDNNTQFLVKVTDKNDVVSYETYTGTANVPSFVAGADVFYRDVNGDNIADYVYINGTKTSTTGAHVVYVTEAGYGKASDSNYYVMENVILDGVENSTITVANLGIANTLAAGEGKTFVVTFNNGVVTDAQLSTVTVQNVVKPYSDSKVVYLGDDAVVSGDTIASEYTGLTYRIDNAAVLGEFSSVSELNTSDLDGFGVWVVYTNDVNNTVSHVYVGKALGETANMYATVKEGTATVGSNRFDEAGETWTYTGTDGESVTLTAAALDNATITSGNKVETVTLTSSDTHNKPFTVVSEAGNLKRDYKVKLEADDVVATAITKVKGVDVSGNGTDKDSNPMYTVTLSTKISETYFTVADISYVGANVEKVNLLVLKNDGSAYVMDANGDPQIATEKVAATEYTADGTYWICALLTLKDETTQTAWIQIVEGL